MKAAIFTFSEKLQLLFVKKRIKSAETNYVGIKAAIDTRNIQFWISD